MNQEFSLSVTPVRADGYLIRVERQSLGVPLAEEFVTSWQVDEWLEQARQLMRDPLLGLLRGNLLSPRSGELPTIDPNIPLPPNLVQFGQTLFDALFHGTIYQSWVTAKGIAHNRREVLHLRLGLKGDVLPRLPWEVLHEGNRPLATGADVVFSRYQATYGSMSTVLTPYRSPVVEQNQPLRILMVLAAPTDQEVLELEREANHLREELTHENGSVGKIELTILNQPGREQLTNALERGRFQVLHYAGHSNLGASGGDLYLVSDRTGLTEVLSGDDLAGLLVNNGIRMAVFNSCRGVYAATADPTNITESGNLTEALLRRGVPAVLAMAERIPDDVALTLSRLFYHNLKQHYPIDLSLSRARQGLLSSYGSNQLYWSLPILYLNPDFDGYLLPPLPAETPQAAPVLAGMQAIPPEDVPSRNPIGFDPNPIDLFEESDPLDELDEPEDADREAVLNLLNELRTGSLAEDPNPFVSSSDRFDTTAFDDAEPKTADEYVRQGKWLYQQGDLPGAIAAYGQALQLDSQAADAYSNMGIALEDYDSPAEALIAYKMAVQLNPDLQETQQRLRRLEIAHNMAPNAAQKGIAGSEAKPDMPIPPAQPVTHVVEPAPESRVFAPNLGQAESKRPRVPIMAIAFLATSLLAGLGLWLALSWRPNSPNTFLPSDRQIPAASPPTTQTGILSAQATQSFNEGDVRRGTDAIQQLLDQGNWNAADAAFSAVPSDKLNEPIVSFLRGRVAWEALKRAERTSYSVEDARRYWETAIRGKKDDPMYYNAVGFAFYAESNLGKAGEAWSQAAKLAAQQRESGNKAALQDELTANAGLALATFKSAKAQPANQANLKQDALRLRNRVQRVDPAGFQPDALGKNWLWTEKAIADWRSLLSEK